MTDLSREALMQHLLYVIWDGLWRMEKFPLENSSWLYDCKDMRVIIIINNYNYNKGYIQFRFNYFEQWTLFDCPNISQVLCKPFFIKNV